MSKRSAGHGRRVCGGLSFFLRLQFLLAVEARPAERRVLAAAHQRLAAPTVVPDSPTFPTAVIKSNSFRRP